MTTLENRIRELMTATGWDAAQVASIAGVSSSAVSQWLGNGSKTINSIGKIEAAIYLERKSGFSALWLAKGVGPKRVREMAHPSASEVHWPFPDIDFSRFEALSANQRIEVQAAVRARIERFEEERTAQNKSQPSARKRA
jgi:transcriptional regulator with XRE-family HTH domain